jgi:hypothetical protein
LKKGRKKQNLRINERKKRRNRRKKRKKENVLMSFEGIFDTSYRKMSTWALLT